MGIFEGESFSIQEIVQIMSEAFPPGDIREGSGALKSQCRDMGLITFSEAQERILRALNAFALAKDGKLKAGQSEKK